MGQTKIIIPSVGESIVEANIGKVSFKTGDWVDKNVPLFEIETDKATVEVVAPDSGRLTIEVKQGETVAIGASVGFMDNSASPPTLTSTVKPIPPPAPAVSIVGGMSMVSETQLKGFGPAKRKAIREGKMSIPSGPTGPSPTLDFTGEQERKPMSAIRKKIAERLIYSQQSTATLTTFNEVDMTRTLDIRGKLKEEFEKKNGIKLGFMSFFSKATCYAISQVPIVNGFVDGDEVVYNKGVHMGIAVSTERGLVVPVVRNAQKMGFSQIEKEIARLADKARTGKLGIDEMMGGTFTITNGGVFGSLLSTPILNPPQSGILGLHKTENRPMAIPLEGGGFKIEVRPMMYVALSYDHRLVDGKDSVTFLVKIKEYLETLLTEKDVS
ncbi:MAG: 2-oxo acid dehydrogenase subunit E2 [Pseudomonadota bacterium]|nr:2-oxo acid dehydrogenase subunit E2 [Pseudomonadota bacterium]